MLPSLDEIPRRRRSLDIKQRDLARLAGVSQSLIAKIEAGKINPSYKLSKAIFDVLESLESRDMLKAGDVMSGKVVGAESSSPVSAVSSLMSEKGYSQLPVYKEGRIVGSVNESTLISTILDSKDPTSLSQLPVKKIMNEVFPIVDATAPVNVVSTLLRYSHAVLVSRAGSVQGIITKADLLKIVKA